MLSFSRRFAVGAETRGGATHFRVWAPRRRSVDVVIEGNAPPIALVPEPDGYFAGLVEGVGAGARYRYRLDGGDAFPDPASRFQPEGPHGPSEVIDPAFAWTDGAWPGLTPLGQVIYEMHVGTFTRTGTFAAAAGELPALRALGVSVIELMPLADFPGRFGWGYDGVDLYAPTRLYGRPEDFRRFVDAAHAQGLGVILDVVYNHVGPDGNYLPQYAETWFDSERVGEWGDLVNFDGPGSAAVREFVLDNAAYWIQDFHLDGLRLDATQAIYDDSPVHVLAELSRRARAAAAPRTLLLVAENEPQETRLARPLERQGYGIDALWNDDFHHSAVVALTGSREAYYNDHEGRPQEFVSSAKYGYLFQGQRYSWQEQRRGRPGLDLPHTAFVHFIENHDQVANSGDGRRMHAQAAPARLRALTALLLLGPATPLLFQGQEFASSAPFLYFADHGEDLAARVHSGRKEFLEQFPGLASAAMQAQVPAPNDPATFARCQLDHAERERNVQAWSLHRDLIALRRADATLAAAARGAVDGAVLGAEAFLLRFFGAGGDDRLLVVNLGPELRLEIAPEPLLAPPDEKAWRVLWSSHDPRYGGFGVWEPETEKGWRLAGESAVLLHPAPAPPRERRRGKERRK